MANSVLTHEQKEFLAFFSSQQSLYKQFYLTGGTCLSEFYLNHRFSEDLDFFSEKEFLASDITSVLKLGKHLLSYSTFDFQQSFNRNIYQIIYPNKTILKVEFTYFPFQHIQKPTVKDNIQIDSLKDIAVNKIFTIHQNPRGRDFYDVYHILQKEKWSIEELISLARIKFDTHIDYLQLGSNLMEVTKLKDDPIITKTAPIKDIEKFILYLAKSFKEKIITK